MKKCVKLIVTKKKSVLTVVFSKRDVRKGNLKPRKMLREMYIA